MEKERLPNTRWWGWQTILKIWDDNDRDAIYCSDLAIVEVSVGISDRRVLLSFSGVEPQGECEFEHYCPLVARNFDRIDSRSGLTFGASDDLVFVKPTLTDSS